MLDTLPKLSAGVGVSHQHPAGHGLHDADLGSALPGVFHDLGVGLVLGQGEVVGVIDQGIAPEAGLALVSLGDAAVDDKEQGE